MGLNHKNVHFFNANTSLCSSADSVFYSGLKPLAFENKQGSQIMDPCNSAQDVIRCDLCQRLLSPPSFCDFCNINLCKASTEGYILKDSKLHIVVPIKNRQSTPILPTSPEHKTKLCELHFERCDIPICVHCTGSVPVIGETQSSGLQYVSFLFLIQSCV